MKVLVWQLVFLPLMVLSCQDDAISIYGHRENDLVQLLSSNGGKLVHYQDITEALEGAAVGGTLMVLAKDYPYDKTVLPEHFYEKAKEKKLKVFVEFPNRLASDTTGPITGTHKERLVVTSDFYGSELDLLSILDAGRYFFVQSPKGDSHIKGANVAGFKKAVYGLEDTPDHAILFEEADVLISTTKLSDFKKSRYTPYNAWRQVMKGILSHLAIDLADSSIHWEPLVKPTWGRNTPLSEETYRSAIGRAADWYEKGRFLIHPQWQDHWIYYDTMNPPVGPPMDLDLPSGDGSLGVMEGHYSYVNPDGSQPYRYWLRADCVAETAMTIAISNGITSCTLGPQVAINLMDFLFNSDAFRTASSRDPVKSSYGLVGWADTHASRYYGDDNARVILGAILASQQLNVETWDKQITELILANFRTAGAKGFRGGSLMGNDIDKVGWRKLMQGQLENIAPHYESWLWAAYLWLYDKTKVQPLLHKAKKALDITMANYPQNWVWTNGIQQERARLILPLSWLVRVEDSKRHRDWLHRICDDLLEHQVACGALREELGEDTKGRYGAPRDNAHYGTTEAPVIHSNGEPIADMLYTTNFAFFALNEAAHATREPKYQEAVQKLADFLVRIQSTSSGRADLDGCWFRAFDYEQWEFYGSNADHGWGAWGTLTGWTQSFITTTLALRVENISFWDVTKDSNIDKHIKEIWGQMLPGIEP